MLRLIGPVIIFLFLGIGGFFLYQNFQTKPATQPTSTPQAEKTPLSTAAVDPCEVLTKGSADVPPLYIEETIWQPVKKDEFPVPLEDRDQLMSGCLIRTVELPYAVSSRVESYYYESLTKLGWNNFAGGDMPGGTVWSWIKNNKYFVVNIDPVKMKPLTQTVTLFYTP